MAIKQCPVIADYGYGYTDYGTPQYIQFTQHFSKVWAPGKIVSAESAWFRLRYKSKDQLLSALQDPETMIGKVLDHLSPRVAAKHFEGLIAETFTIGFDLKHGFTVDAFDKRHLKLIEKHPASGLTPPVCDASASPQK